MKSRLEAPDFQTPRVDRRDGGFRSDSTRPSVDGLVSIAAIGLGATVFMACVAGLAFGNAGRDALIVAGASVGFALCGLANIQLSRAWAKRSGKSRWYGALIVLLKLAVLTVLLPVLFLVALFLFMLSLGGVIWAGG